MRFTISRTSTRYRYPDSDDEAEATRPCEGATLADIDEHSYFTFKSITEATRRNPHLTFEKVDGRVRTVGKPTRQWVIDIDSLDDLMALHHEHGALVIERNDGDHRLAHIDIYDDYRE